MYVLQGNLNKSKAAHDALFVLANKYDANTALVSEPNKAVLNKYPGWVCSANFNAAIWLRNGACDELWKGMSYVAAKLGKMIALSVYLHPNATIGEVSNDLDEMSGLVQSAPNGISLHVGGDMNGWHVSWGSRCNNTRGTMIAE